MTARRGERGLEVETSPDGVVILRGELDFASADTVMTVDAGDAVVDLSGITFMDSVGLQLLLDLRDAIGQDATLVLRNPSTAAQRLLDLADVRYWDRIVVDVDLHGQ